MTAIMHFRSMDGRRLTAMAGVSLVHVILLLGLTLAPRDAPINSLPQPVIDVLMMRPQRVTPPEAVTHAGGGGAAAASRIHAPPALPVDLELPTPIAQAPVPELVVGLAPLADLVPGLGSGGEGTGTGAGNGEGAGDGPVLVQGPQGAIISSNASESALAASGRPYAVLQCYIRAGSERLENCRVTSEHPTGVGIGRSALGKAQEFRYKPPGRMGRFGGRHRQTVAIAFPPEAAAASPGGRH
jgi:protein TonB